MYMCICVCVCMCVFMCVCVCMVLQGLQGLQGFTRFKSNYNLTIVRCYNTEYTYINRVYFNHYKYKSHSVM